MSVSAPVQPPSMRIQAFWLVLSKFTVALFNIILPILLVRFMNQTDYGLYKQAFLFTTTAAVISMGVGQSAFYFMPRAPERAGQIALNILLYNAVAGGMFLVVITAFPQLLENLFRTDALNVYAPHLGIIVLLSLTGNASQQIPTALQDVKGSTLFIVGMQLVRAVLFVAAALLFPAVKSLIIAALITQLICNSLFVGYLYRKFGAFWKQFEWPSFKMQLAYALPMGLFTLLYIVRRDLHAYFVSATLGPADFAIYSVGCMQVPFVYVFMESMAPLIMVRVSALQGQGRTEEIRRVIASAISRVAAVHFPAAALLLITGRDLIVLLYTKNYEASYSVFAVNIFLLPLTAFVIDSVVRNYIEMKSYVIIVRIALIAALFMALPAGIRAFGMVGAVLLSVLIDACERLLYGWRASRIIGVTRRDLALFAHLAKTALATIIIGFVAYGVRDLLDPDLLILRIAVTTICFGTLYLAALHAFRLAGYEDFNFPRLLVLARGGVAKIKGRLR